MATRRVRITLNDKTAAQWAAWSEPPLKGEPCWATDTCILKIGDGVSLWSALPAVGGGSDHSQLTKLSYADSGHSGFAPSSHVHRTPWSTMTDAEMNSDASLTEGMVIWNTTQHQLMVYDGNAWVGVPMQA